MHYREAIKMAIEATSTGLDVGWRTRGSRARDPLNVTLSVRSILARGVDERRHENPDTGDDMGETVTGNRRLTVLVTCESQTDGPEDDASEDDGTPNALELSETIRACLQGSEAEGTLALANLGAPVCGPAMPADYTDGNGDAISVWAFEVFFPTTRTQAMARIPFVKRVIGEGTIKDETGTTRATIPVDTEPE